MKRFCAFVVAFAAFLTVGAGESKAQWLRGGCSGGNCAVASSCKTCGNSGACGFQNHNVQANQVVYGSGLPVVGQYIWVPEVRQYCLVTSVGVGAVPAGALVVPAEVRKMPEPEVKPKAPRNDD